MTGKAFTLLVGGASAATFAGVLFAPGLPKAQATAKGAPAPTAAADASVYYPGCNAVREAGKAPLYRDQPGYRPEMDGDGDGTACEPYTGAGDGGHHDLPDRQTFRGWRRSRRS